MYRLDPAPPPTGLGASDHGRTLVRAKVLSDAPVVAVEARTNGGTWVELAPVTGAAALWQGCCPAGGRLEVRAQDAEGRTDIDAIEPVRSGWAPPAREADGSDRDRVAAWPKRSIPGTQLGPNRNGRPW